MRQLAACATLIVALCASDWGCDSDNGGTSRDTGRDPLICDAIYVPFVTFTFTDNSTGDPYCGPVTVSFTSQDSDATGDTSCVCDSGDVVTTPGGLTCHVNPPEGETSTISVEAPGYETFTQDVTLPYECHPQATVDVLLEPSSS